VIHRRSFWYADSIVASVGPRHPSLAAADESALDVRLYERWLDFDRALYSILLVPWSWRARGYPRERCSGTKLRATLLPDCSSVYRSENCKHAPTKSAAKPALSRMRAPETNAEDRRELWATRAAAWRTCRWYRQGVGTQRRLARRGIKFDPAAVVRRVAKVPKCW